MLTLQLLLLYVLFVGEKLTDEEVDMLLQGVEDSQGQVNYEGMYTLVTCFLTRTIASCKFCH